MTQLKSRLMMALVLLFSGLMTTAPVNAQQASDAEIKQMIQEQFERMYQKGVKDLKERIVVTGGVKPFAVVTDTADKSKTIRIKQIEEMPASVALEVLRRSLVALVKKGKIGATAVFYTTANPNEESDAKQVLVVEMEHIFGPTLAQLVPYTVMEGQARFGEQVVVDMESRIFNLKASDEVSE